ncbi:hypothetical protein BJF96_g7454 [Verticillium dahliae]|uniref:Ubiquitin-conjugating enzyme E2C-binding protein n=1 Tax=Verticillium dahliae TaxID=27337 RepID=A0A2J8CQJ4_VERDA|nr:hypothetical protein BJF96_g7454 [Verticillium dahliae]PNH39292.1 hypothetical protein VD0003_g10197 [Verticillium dahliae]RXG45504.1 hypothetical protein VDGE_03108 [Verticillium dahliae]
MAPMATHDTVVIYAELLPNIRHISVAVSLPSPVDASTSVQTSAHGDSILVTHRGESTEARLPGPVSAPSALPIPATPPSGPTSLAWRLPVSTSVTLPSTRHELQPTVPWSAHDLTPKAAVACRQCGEAVVPEGRLHVWKDLPSENWAEMMDFWHCHKPHDHGQEKNGDGDHDDEHLTKRGYGANSSIAAQTRVGFVDLTSFLLAEEDCTGLRFSTPDATWTRRTAAAALDADPAAQPPRLLHVTCASCAVHMGFYNTSIASVVLFKWQTTCAASSTPAETAPPTGADCLAATLLATLSRSGSSKSVIVPTIQAPLTPNDDDSEQQQQQQQQALHVWVLNSNITYASSLRPAAGPRSALKLLYKPIAVAQADAMLASFALDVQEVTFPAAVIAAAARGFEASALLLPAGERLFHGWRVALLDKWVG